MGGVLKVDFIGAGNLAYNLAPALEKAGVTVRNIYSRNPENAIKLASRLYEGQVIEDLDFSESTSNIFIIAVPDDVIEEIVKELVLPENAIIAHTSGSVPLSILGYAATPDIGVFYPLQTFTKNNKVDFNTIPILIEGDNNHTTKTLRQLAQTLSSNVQEVTSKQRQSIHLAAVFACNFTNWMLTQSSNIMQEANLDFNLLQTLIAQTINNSFENGPAHSQTGPAIRGDFEILDTHMSMLAPKPALQELYQMISQQILDHYQNQPNE